MKRLSVMGILACCLVCFSVGSAWSHEFIIKPVKTMAHESETLPFSVLSAHVFMVSEEVEPIDNVSVQVVSQDGSTPVALSENSTLMTLDGAATLGDHGTSIIAGHRKGMVWTQTTQGWKQAPKSACTGVIGSGKYEKFCKTLVNTGASDKGYGREVGHDLEIVPVDDPATSAGETLTVKVLYKGKPLATNVHATYDGFSQDAGTWAYATSSDAKGLARIKVTRDGTWMVRVEKTEENKTKEYDKHVMRAVLVFGAG